MRKLVVSLLFVFQVAVLMAGDYKLLVSIPIGDAQFTTDPLGNFYIFNKGDITRYDAAGKETGSYSIRDYGDISYVDASNPLKILVVYREFSKAVLLDAAMSLTSLIDLSFPGIPFVSVICTSRENGYWIVDPTVNQLKKINDQHTVITEGTPFRQVTDEGLRPGYLTDSGNWLVMNAYGYGVMIFDRFGTYYKSIRTIPEQPIQAWGDEVLYKEQTAMVRLNIRTGETTHFKLPENAPEDICRVENSRIYIKSSNLLKIYSY